MQKCPVCDNQNHQIPCPVCGFDASLDVEHYPTLVPVSLPLASISGRIRNRMAQHADLLRCPACGDTRFFLSLKDLAHICANCRQQVSVDQIEAQRQPTPQPVTPDPNHSILDTVLLCADGRVRATGDNDYGQCDVENWEDIVLYL